MCLFLFVHPFEPVAADLETISRDGITVCADLPRLSEAGPTICDQAGKKGHSDFFASVTITGIRGLGD